MTMFDERERAFEQMFVHDEQMRFWAVARRNKLVGLWAAKQLGLKPQDADTYTRECVDMVLQRDGDRCLLRRIAADLGGLADYWTEARLLQVIEEFTAKAATEVRSELA
jgi:hypothetical protein